MHDAWKDEVRRIAKEVVRLELDARAIVRNIADKPFSDPDPGDADRPKGQQPIFPMGREAHEIDTWKMRYEREHLHALNLKQRIVELTAELNNANALDYLLNTKGIHS